MAKTKPQRKAKHSRRNKDKGNKTKLEAKESADELERLTVDMSNAAIEAVGGDQSDGNALIYADSTSKHAARRINEFLDVRPSPGKGNGLFATVDIKPGTLLLEEVPVLPLQLEGNEKSNEKELQHAVRQLPAGAERRFMNLSEGKQEFRSKEMRIYVNNMFNGGGIGAILLTISLINHSCVPNVWQGISASSEQMGFGMTRIYSLCDIKTGDEITHQYLAHLDWMNASERQAIQQFLWGFTCSCESCSNPEARKASDRRRGAMAQIYFKNIDRKVPEMSPAAFQTRPDGFGPPIMPLEMEHRYDVFAKAKGGEVLAELCEEEGLRDRATHLYKNLFKMLLECLQENANSAECDKLVALTRKVGETYLEKLKVRCGRKAKVLGEVESKLVGLTTDVASYKKRLGPRKRPNSAEIKAAVLSVLTKEQLAELAASEDGLEESGADSSCRIEEEMED